MLYTESAVDGSTLEATVTGLTFGGNAATLAPPSVAPGQTAVTVFFHRSEEELVPVTRLVPATAGVLRTSLEQLLAGPTDEEQVNGLSSWFSRETEGMLNGVTLGAGGTAVVDLEDLRPIIPNASTSAGSMQLLGQLNATVFQFPTVTSVDYRINGSCEAFFEWLQRGCEVVERPGGG
jgi:spore germination protein GerM